MEQSGRKPLELYLHIPFCASKCKYCDFRSAPASGAARQAYVKDLCRKIRSHGDLAEVSLVVSIFLGGGTPSILEAEETGQIFQAIRETFSLAEDVEITTEMNPGTVSREKLKIYRNLGINRLSIGLQSMDDRELAMLGRIHTRQDFLDTYQMAREEGFSNINVDLISAIPYQTAESWRDTLIRTAQLGPEHISAYSLIIEEGTPFYERYGEGRHAEILCRIVHTLRVQIRSEADDLSLCGLIGLQALKAFLTVLEDTGTFIDPHLRIVGKSAFTPGAVLIFRHISFLTGPVYESKVFPVQIFQFSHPLILLPLESVSFS